MTRTNAFLTAAAVLGLVIVGVGTQGAPIWTRLDILAVAASSTAGVWLLGRGLTTGFSARGWSVALPSLLLGTTGILLGASVLLHGKEPARSFVLAVAALSALAARITAQRLTHV